MAIKLLMMGWFLISENHLTKPAAGGKSDPDGSRANYAIIGTMMEVRLKAITAAGDHAVVQSSSGRAGIFSESQMRQTI
jgi:proline racemase